MRTAIYFYFDSLSKTITFEVKTSILHQFTKLKASSGYFIPG